MRLALATPFVVLALLVPAPALVAQQPAKPVQPAAPAQPPAAAAPGGLAVIVFDSVAGRPLADAEVQLVRDGAPASEPPQSARTDADGLASFAGLAPARYLVGFFHPKLDSLGLVLGPAAADVPAGREVTVQLGVPSAATISAAYCRDNPRAGAGGTLIGRVRDAATGMPLPGSSVVAWWEETLFDARGLRKLPRVLRSTANEDGVYAFCGVPLQGAFGVLAKQGTDSTGEIQVELQRRALAVRDLRIARAPAPGDTTRALAAGARLRGIVRGPNGQPLRGVHVTVLGSGVEATTSDSGTFTLAGLPAGSQTAEAKLVGFAPQRVSVDLSTAHQATARFTLSPVAAVLEEVRVKGRRTAAQTMAEFDRRRQSGMGSFLTEADIRRRGSPETTDLLRTVPSVQVQPGGTQQEDVVTMRSSAGYCRPTFYIDGMRFTQDVGGLNALVKPQDIIGMEVYRSSAEAPPQFQDPLSGCGSIVVWTRFSRARGSR